MTVLMTLKVEGDPEKLVALSKADPQRLQDIVADGKAHGALHHAFYANGSTVFVVDEWPDEASFQKFFSSNTEIPKLMAEVGVTAEPEIAFYRKLDTGDDF
jgi:hypothetical protein